MIAEDIFDDFLASAKQRAENQKLDNVTFVKGTETDPKLPEGAVDIVLALDVYHHFDYPEKMLAAIHKSLKPGRQTGDRGVLQAPGGDGRTAAR